MSTNCTSTGSSSFGGLCPYALPCGRTPCSTGQGCPARTSVSPVWW